jgi:hypothetical protein
VHFTTVHSWMPEPALEKSKADEPVRMTGKDGKSYPTKYTPRAQTSALSANAKQQERALLA